MRREMAQAAATEEEQLEYSLGQLIGIEAMEKQLLDHAEQTEAILAVRVQAAQDGIKAESIRLDAEIEDEAKRLDEQLQVEAHDLEC